MDTISTTPSKLILQLLFLFSLAWTKETGDCGIRVAEHSLCLTKWPRDVVATLGVNLRLSCAAVGGGEGGLRIEWFHNGTKLRGREREGESLILREVRWVDEGEYHCRAGSGKGRVVSPRARVHVSRPPSFSSHPQDVAVGVGGTARLQCGAEAIPYPFITWLHNDLPLRDDIQHSRFRILDSGILHIYSVQESDAGSYLCFASNSAGNASSRTATLTTSPEPRPSNKWKVLQAPTNQSVAVGRDALLECLIDSVLPTNIVWERLGRHPPVLGEVELVGTNLRVRGVERSDEGYYGCRVNGSSAQSDQHFPLKAYLSVEYPPTIHEFPTHQRKRRGETARFKCFTDSKPIPEIIWFRNGEKVSPKGRVKLFPSEDEPPGTVHTPHGSVQYRRDLVVSTVQPGDVGMYECMVSNKHGHAAAAAALSFIPPEKSADAPKSLNATVDQASRTVKLSWEAPPGIKVDNIAIYIVHFYETDGGNENTHAVQCREKRCEGQCCSGVELHPYTNYSFFVSVLSQGSEGAIFSPPSNTVVVQTWHGEARAVAPLTVTGLSGGAVHLHWEEPDSESAPGKVTEYRVEYRKEGSMNIHSTFLPFPIEEHTLDGLGGGVVYLFRVVPKTRAGYPKPPLSDDKYPWTAHEVQDLGQVPVAPLLEAEPINSTTIHVFIEPGGESMISGFTVKCHLQLGPDAPFRTMTVPVDQKSVYIRQLAPGSLYEISAAAVSVSGKVGLEASHTVRTHPKPLLAVSNDVTPIVEYPVPIWCQSQDPGRLVVKWHKPQSDRDISRYTVRYSPIPDDPDGVLNVSYVEYAEVHREEFMADFLILNRNYIFAVRSWDRFNYTGPFSGDFMCRSPGKGETVSAPGSPTNLKAEERDASIVDVSWSPPVDSRNSDLMYTVYYTHSLDNAWSEIHVNGSLSVGVGNLSEASKYFFKVSATNQDGVGPPTPVVEVPRRGLPTLPPSSSPSSLPSTSSTTPLVIERVSYKEGIIVGSCIAVVCVLLCALILCNRRKLETWSRAGGRDRPTMNGTPKSNGHIPERKAVVEIQEMQTLLPPLIENSECDAKGGETGPLVQGRLGCHLDRGTGRERNGSGPPNGLNGYFYHPPPSHYHLAHPPSLLSNSKDLAVSVLSALPNATEQETMEMSSDLSHSPAATASSVHSGSQEDCGPCGGVGGSGVEREGETRVHHLGDSGIGFDCCDPHLHNLNHYHKHCSSNGNGVVGNGRVIG